MCCAVQNKLDEESLARLKVLEEEKKKNGTDANADEADDSIEGGIEVAASITANVWEIRVQVSCCSPHPPSQHAGVWLPDWSTVAPGISPMTCCPIHIFQANLGSGCVQVGDEVKEGDVLMVLEAMKMEVAVAAPAAGKVAAIKVQPSTLTQQGDVLAVLVPLAK